METPKHDTATPAGEKPTTTVDTALAEEPKKGGRFTRLVRWALVFLITFGFGALLVVFTLYIPARARWIQAENDKTRLQQDAKTQADETQARINDLQDEISRLSAFENQNKALQAELDQTKLHVAVLSARADVAVAHLALVQEDNAAANIALGKTAETLQQIEDMLPASQKQAVSDMQERLTLAVKGIKDSPYAATSDLDVLATSLLELENAFFAKP